jgi:hypothetical protein
MMGLEPARPLPALPWGVHDGRARFREIFAAVRAHHGRRWADDMPVEEALRRLPDEPPPTGRPVALGRARLPLRILLVPGLYGECVADLVTPFAGALEHLDAACGWRTALLPVSGRASSRHNAAQIRDFLAALPAEPAEKLVLVGYSKGICDVLEAVVEHEGVRQRVDAVVSIAGAVGGSALAERVPEPLHALLRQVDLPFCDPGDGGGVSSLRRADRRRWLRRHTLPGSIRWFSLVALPEPERVSAVLRPGYGHLAAMDPANDGQVLWSDAIIPGSTLLGYANADHWAIALPIVQGAPARLQALAASLVDRNAFPREVLLEAVVRQVEEELARPDLLAWLRRRWARPEARAGRGAS